MEIVNGLASAAIAWILEDGWVFLVPFIVWNIAGFGNSYKVYHDAYGAETAVKLKLLRDIKAILIVILSVLIMILWQTST